MKVKPGCMYNNCKALWLIRTHERTWDLNPKSHVYLLQVFVHILINLHQYSKYLIWMCSNSNLKKISSNIQIYLNMKGDLQLFNNRWQIWSLCLGNFRPIKARLYVFIGSQRENNYFQNMKEGINPKRPRCSIL